MGGSDVYVYGWSQWDGVNGVKEVTPVLVSYSPCNIKDLLWTKV